MASCCTARVYGRSVSAIGQNMRAARLAGIPVDGVALRSPMCCARVLAALCGYPALRLLRRRRAQHGRGISARPRSPWWSSAARRWPAATPTCPASGARRCSCSCVVTMLNTYGVGAGVRLLADRPHHHRRDHRRQPEAGGVVAAQRPTSSGNHQNACSHAIPPRAAGQGGTSEAWWRGRPHDYLFDAGARCSCGYLRPPTRRPFGPDTLPPGGRDGQEPQASRARPGAGSRDHASLRFPPIPRRLQSPPSLPRAAGRGGTGEAGWVGGNSHRVANSPLRYSLFAQKISPHPPPPVESLHPPTGSEVATNDWWEGDRVVGESFPIRPKTRPAGPAASQAAINAG